MQELTVRETRSVGQWELTITRDDIDGETVGYIVNASCRLFITTLQTFKVGSGGECAAVAFHYALRYLRMVEKSLAKTNKLPCYRPLSNRFYN